VALSVLVLLDPLLGIVVLYLHICIVKSFR
jgi:hypothetical protein